MFFEPKTDADFPCPIAVKRVICHLNRHSVESVLRIEVNQSNVLPGMVSLDSLSTGGKKMAFSVDSQSVSFSGKLALGMAT